MTSSTIGTRQMRRIAVTLLAPTLLCCQPAFDDDTQSLLVKPEILSIVLEPPEAAPGETVEASFLVADARGVMKPTLNLWLPFDPASADTGVASSMKQLMQQSGLNPASLSVERLRYTLGQDFSFGADGLAQQPLSLAVQTAALPPGIDTPEQVLANLTTLSANGSIRRATRTLVVSNRNAKNANPAVAHVTGSVEQGAATDLTLVRSSDADLAGARRAAADNPLLVPGGRAVTFEAVRKNDGDPEEVIRYQWISTGGDFGGLREREQEWIAPHHATPTTNERDQRGQTDVDWRADPNLYPVWLIVRDTGDGSKRGQSWVELYVRIVPS